MNCYCFSEVSLMNTIWLGFVQKEQYRTRTTGVGVNVVKDVIFCHLCDFAGEDNDSPRLALKLHKSFAPATSGVTSFS
jgi:hypothetical protein